MIKYLIPFEKIGDFCIESILSDYKNSFNFKFIPSEDSTGWDIYEVIDEGLSLYVEKDKIKSISCEQECLYQGRNIIGMHIDEFINHFDLIPESEVDTLWVDDDERQDVYEFDSIGLQVWCKNDLIVTVIASSNIL